MLKKKSYILGIITLPLLIVSSCDSDPCEDLNLPVGFICDDGNIVCTQTCAAGEVLAIDCTCIIDASTIIPDPCAGTAACDDGFVKEASTCDCIEIMPVNDVSIDGGVLTSSVAIYESINGTIDLGNLTLPAFYDIDGAFAPGAYNGQIRRIAQLNAIVSFTRDEPINVDLADLIRNPGQNQFDAFAADFPDALGGSDLRTKIDELNFDNGDTSVADDFESLADSLVTSSANFAVTAANGTAGIITTGDKRRHVSANGLEYAQILEKGMFGPLLYDQMVDDYLRPSQSGPDNAAGNNESASGSDYASLGTDRQHRWDEAFGYLGANPMTYPNETNTSTGDGDFMANYIFDFSDETEAAFGIHLAQEIMDSYVLGRAILKAGEGFGPTNETTNEAALEACRQDIKLYVEAGLTAAAFHYLNLAIADVTEDDKLHHLSKALGFIYSLSHNSEGRVTSAEAYDILEDLGWAENDNTLTGVYAINLWEVTDAQMQLARQKLDASFPGFINVDF